MSSRILTTSIAGIDACMRDPRGVLTHAEGGTVAVFADNAPAFYAITPERLAQLLEIEAQLARPASDVTLDTQFFDEPVNVPVTVPMGKFALYAGWQPDADFQRQAALWGEAANAWGMWAPKAAGTYDVCFGPVPGYTSPPCQYDVPVAAGATKSITGTYSPG